MDDDVLAKAFNGWKTPGFNETSIKEELSGPEASQFLEKCMKDERLKKGTTWLAEHISDPALKDQVVDFVLREPGVWHIDEGYRPGDNNQMAQTSGFVSQTLRKEFFLEESDPLVNVLQRALLDKSNRYLVANLFDRIAKMDREKRTKDDPGVEEVVAELRRTMARLEEKGAIPFSPAKHGQGGNTASKEPTFVPWSVPQADGKTGNPEGNGKPENGVLADASPASRPEPVRWLSVLAAIAVLVVGVFVVRKRLLCRRS